MNDDLVFRRAAIEAMTADNLNWNMDSVFDDDLKRAARAAQRALARLPAADVREVVHGRWIDGKGNAVPWDEANPWCPSGSCYCSVCREWLAASDEYPVIGKYCPNCGAKMDLEGAV